MNSERTPPLGALQQEMREQDNLATALPLFIVETTRRVYGMDPAIGFCPHDWLYEEEDYAVAPDKLKDVLDAMYERDCEEVVELDIGSEHDGKWTRRCYAEEWDFVSAFFTKKAADQYIRQNAHNLNEPRVFCYSMNRNPEMGFVMKMLRGEYDQG